MVNLTEMIEIIRAENPDGLKIGDDATGYKKLNLAQTEEIFTSWAKARLEKKNTEEILNEKKSEAEAKLANLGLALEDLRVLGLA